MLHGLNILARAFDNNPTFKPILVAAVGAVKIMNREKTCSVLSQTTHRTIFGEAGSDKIGKDLSTPQICRILDLFNDYGKDELSDTERNEFQDTLLEALKAAVFGVSTWWHYKNNEGNPIPEWFLEERIRLCPIWLEDRKEGT